MGYGSVATKEQGDLKRNMTDQRSSRPKGPIELKIADDFCPSCSHVIEVFVPQPYASGPELLEVLEQIVERSLRLDEHMGPLPEDGFALREKAISAIAKAKGE